MKGQTIFFNSEDSSLIGNNKELTEFRAELKDVVEAAMESDKEEAERNEYLNNLMKGKVFIN
jgi:hypothetical protein